MSDPLRNVEAEQTLLGTILLRAEGLDCIEGIIQPDHFSEPLHGEIFRAATRAKAEGLTPSLMTVLQAMSSVEMPDNFEIRPYLARLASSAVPTSLAPEYAAMIVELWRRREIVRSLDVIRAAAAQGGVGPLSETAMALAREELGRLESRVSSAARGRENRLGRISIGEVSTRPIVVPDFVVDDWMMAREISFIAGESQSGKTFVTLHAAICVALGQDVLGKRTKPGLVIYQSGESGSGLLNQRIPGWIAHFGQDIDFSTVPLEILPESINLFRLDGNAEVFHSTIKKIVDEWSDRANPRLIIIDTWSSATAGANENSGQDVSGVIDHGKRLARSTGAHVCFLHHFPKGGTTMRGHGSLKGDVDTVAMVAAGANGVRTIRFDKVKDGAAGATLSFELKQVVIGQRPDDGRAITSCVVLQVGQKDAARKAAEAKGFALGVNEAPIFAALWSAIKKSGRFPDKIMEDAGVPATTFAVDWDIWKEEYRLAATPDEGGNPPSDDLIRKHYKRYGESLEKRFKIIGRSGRWLWVGNKPVRGYPDTYPEKDKFETLEGQTAPSDELAGVF